MTTAPRHPAKIAWDERNRERKRAITKAWWALRPGYKATWRSANPDLEMAQRERGRPAKAVYTAQYAATHREQRVASEQKRRARKLAAGGNGVSTEQWVELCAEYGQRCAYCAAERPLTMDHFHPLSKGGLHDVANITPVCRRCNSRKQGKPFVVWLATAHRGIRQ